ncbi:MAG TPA: hypothetical protein VGJ66_04940 [Pyrinomonadaceae bacterium]
MGPNLEGPPDSLVKALSKPNGRNVAKAAGALLSWANSKRDHALTERSLDLMRPAIHTLTTALPETDPELIGGIFANLLDLWETGQKLDKELQKLKKLRLPQDREGLRSTLLWIDAIQLDMASYWIGEVKKDLPKLLKALDRFERRSVPGKQKRRLPKARPGDS